MTNLNQGPDSREELQRAATDVLQGVALVTGNRGKLEEARRLCGAELAAVELDLPEIQSRGLWRQLQSVKINDKHALLLQMLSLLSPAVRRTASAWGMLCPPL